MRVSRPRGRGAGEYFYPSKKRSCRAGVRLRDEAYWDFGVLPELPLELPLELPEPMLPLLPEPLVLGVVGEVGDVVELPLVPPAAPELDLLKCASHSARDTCPSLFVSTEEKLGADELLLEPDMPPLEPLVLEPPEAALPPVAEEPDEPVALPDEPELLPDAAGEDEDEELCATATLDSANSAAAVAALRTLSFNMR